MKLVKMFDVVSQLPEEEQALEREASRAAVGGGGGGGGGGAELAASESAASYNVRVNVADGDDEEEDDDDDEGVEADIPDRNTMKKIHGQLLDKASNKGKNEEDPRAAPRQGVQ